MTGSMYKNTANQPGPRKRYTNQPADMHLILPKVEQISLRKLIQRPPPSKKTIFNPFSDLAILLLKPTL